MSKTFSDLGTAPYNSDSLILCGRPGDLGAVLAVTQLSHISHTHSSLYSLLTHLHTGVYALFDHSHADVYSLIDHNHASLYAGLTEFLEHNHNALYSLLSHLHTGVYSLIDHLHTGLYSLTTHNHDAIYPLINHGHNELVEASVYTLAQYNTYHIVRCNLSYSNGGGAAFRGHSDRGTNDEVVDFYVGNGVTNENPLYLRHSDYGPYCIVMPNSTAIKPIAQAWDTYASSVEWKSEIVKIPNPIEKISALNGVTFIHDMPGEQVDGKEDVGIVFEELESIGIPGVATRGETGAPEGVNLSKLIPLLVETINAQQAEINALKDRVVALEEKVK